MELRIVGGEVSVVHTDLVESGNGGATGVRVGEGNLEGLEEGFEVRKVKGTGKLVHVGGDVVLSDSFKESKGVSHLDVIARE